MDNNLVLYKISQPSPMPQTTDMNEILALNNCIIPRDMNKILVAFDNQLYDMSAEYIWRRTIATLKDNILRFGADFVAEMLDRPGVNSENISDYEIINLSSDLGFVNKVGRLELLQTSEFIQYYLSNDDNEVDFPITRAQDIIRACVQYVLRFGKMEFDSSFSDFRNSLKTSKIDSDDAIVSELKMHPYFYKKTVQKTLLNLAKTLPSGAERETLFANMIIILGELWVDLSSDDRSTIGRAYAQANVDGDKDLLKVLKSLLMRVKGFDYVPENLRSNTYIGVAKNLLSAHFAFDNFYNEPKYAKELEALGSSIPSPALGTCFTSVLACVLGNRYGHSNAAQIYLRRILDSLTVDRWEYYLNNLISFDATTLYKIYESDKTYNRWVKVVEEYKLNDLSVTNIPIQKLVSEITKNNTSSAKKMAKSLYDKLIS